MCLLRFLVRRDNVTTETRYGLVDFNSVECFGGRCLTLEVWCWVLCYYPAERVPFKRLYIYIHNILNLLRFAYSVVSFRGLCYLNHKLIRHLFLQSITTEKTTHRNRFQRENVGTLAVSSLNKNPLVAGTWWYKFMVLPFSSGQFWASNVLFFSSIWVFPKTVGTQQFSY